MKAKKSTNYGIFFKLLSFYNEMNVEIYIYWLLNPSIITSFRFCIKFLQMCPLSTKKGKVYVKTRLVKVV